MNRDTLRSLAIATLASSPTGTVQHELAEAVLSHPFGELRPLEWRQTPIGEIADGRSGYYQVITAGTPQYWACPGGVLNEAESIVDGKQQCQEHYEAMVAKMFRPIRETV